MTTPTPVSDPKSLVRTGYDSIARSYLDFISSLPSSNIVWTDKLLTHLASPSTSRVLELGCGNGVRCTLHLAPKVRSVVANDISSAQIALVREKLAEQGVGGNIEFIVGDMTELSFPAEEFDGVSALYSLIHLPLDEQPKMLRLVHGCLKPGGMLLCNFDVEEDAGSVMDDWLGTKMFKAGHGVDGSMMMVREAGFELIETEVIGTVNGKKTVPFLWVLARKP